LELQKNNTQLSHLLKGWTPTVHTKTRPHPTSSKAGVTSFGAIVGCNNFKFILQPKSNEDVTHQRAFAQITICKFWNYIKTHTFPTYKKVGPQLGTPTPDPIPLLVNKL